MNVTTTIPAQIEIRRSRLAALVVAVAAVVAMVTWALTAYAFDSGSAQSEPQTLTRASVLTSLTPSERRYVNAITSMSPIARRAAFGTDATSARAAVLATLTPTERRHVLQVLTLTPRQLAAVFGTGR